MFRPRRRWECIINVYIKDTVREDVDGYCHLG